MSGSGVGIAATLIERLKTVLLDLRHNPYPTLANPPDLKKRASVALIIRINPSYAQWPPDQQQEELRDTNNHEREAACLEKFFDQPWTQKGTPEVLFIKRASRLGDRWTGHVALPGGRRDPDDADDEAAAVRETWEEVGIELSKENCIPCGNLPQRLVTTSWGKIPLMVLCPFVFLLTNHNLFPLRLQPTEIASAHWVPLTSLLASDMRTFEYQDVTNRLAKQEFGIKRRLYQLALGKMMFSAVRLIPSESLYCTESNGYGLERLSGTSAITHAAKSWPGLAPTFSLSTDKPLLLWGLTLGVMADFLEFLPPYNALSLWAYPTFSPPDVRLIIWLLSYRFRQQKRNQLSVVNTEAPAIIELGLDSVPKPKPRHSNRISEEAEPSLDSPEAGISGMGIGQEYSRGPLRRRRGSRSSRVGFMLDGYYEIIRRGVAVAFVGRLAAAVAVLLLLLRYTRASRSRVGR